MTMRELANLANVSVSTVSKAFNDADDVSADTKNHIFEIAKANGCYGKFYKGKFSKKVIAIICQELVSNYYISFIEHLRNYIESNGGIAVISTYNFSSKKQSELIEYYASYINVDGIIVFNLASPIKKGYDIPIVSLFTNGNSNIDLVTVNFDYAINDAIELLYEKGHRNIAFIGENYTSAKKYAFYESCKKFPNITAYTYENEYRFEKSGQCGVKDMLADNNGCTAIICAYDNIAIGAIKQLKKEGYSVPEDFSVIGMDNIDTAEYIDTTLTSIDSNTEEICKTAWDLLEKKQKNKFYRTNKEISINARLVIRESVSYVKK